MSGSFHDDLRSAALRKPPCAECGYYHMGFCPVPGPTVERKLSEDVLAALGLFAEAMNPTGDIWYCCRVRCGDIIAFCRAVPMNGVWIELLGAVVDPPPIVGLYGPNPCPKEKWPASTGSEWQELCVTRSSLRTHGFRTSVHVRLDEVQWVTRQGEDA